jgi:hypothetical protein
MKNEKSPQAQIQLQKALENREIRKTLERAIAILCNGLNDPQVSGPARWHIEAAIEQLRKAVSA